MDAVHPLGSQAPGKFSIEKNVNSGDREGARIALEIAPSENLTITPRFVYQKVAMEGWNRVDEFNILANPYTTTRPPVTLGGKKQFTQINEPLTDKFQLGDLTIKYDFGSALLTSVTSFTNRDILVVRDATALTASVTGGSLGLPENIYTLDSPLYDATQAHGWTQELRFSGGNDKDRFRWLVGGFYSDFHRAYQQKDIAKGFDDLCSLECPPVFNTGGNDPQPGCVRAEGQYVLVGYSLQGPPVRILRRRHVQRHRPFQPDRGSALLQLQAGQGPDLRRLVRPLWPTRSTRGQCRIERLTADGVAPRFIASYKVGDSTTINAQASKGFRLGGLNDPLLLPLCNPEDARGVRRSRLQDWGDETAWNYEIGSKTRFMGGRGSI